MVSVKEIREAAVRQGFKLMGNPKVMKLMGDPLVMKAVSGAFMLRGKVNAAVDQGVARLAKRLHLYTQKDVDDLSRTIRDLEKQLDRSAPAARTS